MFLYFDLGNVLLHFSHALQCEQMAAAASTVERPLCANEVRRVVFESDLWDRYECGRIDSRAFYEEFCRATETQPDYNVLASAVGDIFTTNVSIAPVISALAAAGYPLGVLSNTNPLHWEHVTRGGRFGLLRGMFRCQALSYKLGCAKPDPSIFRQAAELAGARPSEIFFTDDTPGHVQAAKAAGWNAVHYTNTNQLVHELHELGLQFNY